MGGGINSRSRSEDSKSLIRSLWSPPIVIDNFLTDDEMTRLKVEIAEARQAESHRGQSETSLTVSTPRPSELPLFFQRKLRRMLPDFRIRSLFAFDSNTPFMLHTDSGLDPDVIPYKNMTFCLEENTFEEQLVLYNASCYFSVSINNLKDFVYSEDVVRSYNYLLATPEEFHASSNVVVDKSTPESVSLEHREHLIRHIDPDLRKSFRVVDTIRFEKNRMIVFDSCQLHSGSSLIPVRATGVPKRMILFTEYRPKNGSRSE